MNQPTPPAHEPTEDELRKQYLDLREKLVMVGGTRNEHNLLAKLKRKLARIERERKP